MNGDTNQKQKDALDKRLDAIGWALFFIMIGGLWLAPEGSLPAGTWLIGTGIIILGMTWIRKMNNLAISGFWIFMGILALASGVSSVFGLNIPVFPVLLIIIGLSVILKPFLGGKEGQTEEIEEFQIDPTRLNTYRGYYRIRPDYVIFIDRQDTRLTAQVTGGQRYTLFALSETRFSRRDVDAEYLFHLNNIGDVTGLTLKENSRTQKGEKIAQPALSPLQRQAYTGKFYSPELDTFYRIVLEEGQLIARHRRHEDIPLTIITPDYYSGREWFFRVVHFLRDQNENITGFLLTGGRVRHLRFNKIEGIGPLMLN